MDNDKTNLTPETLKAKLDIALRYYVRNPDNWAEEYATSDPDVKRIVDDTVAALERLEAQINWLINTFANYDEDGLFTFPDGDMFQRPTALAAGEETEAPAAEDD